MPSVNRDTQNLTTDPGLSAALRRNPAEYVHTELFKALGVRMLGDNLVLPEQQTTSTPIPLTDQHYDFLESLPRRERRDYCMIVVPGSASPTFFRELYSEYHRRVNQGEWAVAPVMPQQGYVQLVQLPNAIEPHAAPSLDRIDASPQALIIGELSARLKGKSLLPQRDSFLESALCKATGPSRQDSVKYLIGESSNGLLHVVIDDGGYLRGRPVKALECKVPD